MGSLQIWIAPLPQTGLVGQDLFYVARDLKVLLLEERGYVVGADKNLAVLGGNDVAVGLLVSAIALAATVMHWL